MAYDSKCYDLSEAFLQDEPTLNTEARRTALAQSIQDAIENFITDEKRPKPIDDDVARCRRCGEPMPAGEEMLFYHGYSGPCPKPPLGAS